MHAIMLKNRIKPFGRKLVWAAKKKAAVQILTPRCRRDGLPEYGRFTPRDISQIVSQADQNIQELMPYFNDHESIGNYLNEYGGLIDLAFYRALVKEKIELVYAIKLIGDMIWQARLNSKGFIPIIDPLRIQVAKLTTKDPLAFLGRRIQDGMKYPYGKPGYRITYYRENNVHCMDIYTCPVYDFYKQFGPEEMSLFRKTWCTFDYAIAEHLVEGGKYLREHTLSDGDELCDMRWFIADPDTAS